MAKLGVFYRLCPILNQEDILGISENSDNNIVITSTNIALKHNLINQKQLHIWHSKFKFTSAVLYNEHDNSYVAVINNKFIQNWSGEADLESAQKLKVPIHTILKCGNNNYIIFQNGSVCNLIYGMVNRKDYVPDNILEVNEIIKDVLTYNVGNETYIGFITSKEDNLYFTWYIHDDLTSTLTSASNKIELSKDGSILKHYFLVENESGNVMLYTLWSNKELLSVALNGNNTEMQYFATIDSINCEEQIYVKALNNDFVAIYSADVNQEGSNLMLYNLKYQIIQATQHFKLYSTSPVIWLVHNQILLCVGQNLLVVPFHLEENAVSTLVGSQKVNVEDDDIEIIQEVDVSIWGNDKNKDVADKLGANILINNEQQIIGDQLIGYIKQGWSESAICQEIIPKFIEEKNINALQALLNFCKTIPESVTGKLLEFVIADNEIFAKENVDQTNKNSLIPFELNNPAKCRFLNQIINLDFCFPPLIPYLRAHLDFPNAMLLLKYINYLFHSDTEYFPEHRLVGWTNALLDSYYKHIILQQNVDILEIVAQIRQITEDRHEFYHQLQEIRNVLELIQSNFSVKNVKPHYSITAFDLDDYIIN